ncbi:MAG: type II secretion system protein GspD [Verrucomicrobia bacterium]|nr:type II secretion system protein GspD [Verrucomicrobiota bacterium]
MFVLILSLLCAAFFIPLEGITISEKRATLLPGSSSRQVAGSESSSQISQALADKKQQLHLFYATVQQEYASIDDGSLNTENLNARIAALTALRQEIRDLEEKWIASSKQGSEQEAEGLWHQPDTTIGQLIVDYGSCDYIYLIPPEITGLKVHVSSQLSVPRVLWNEMLELILAQSGVGVKQLNPFLRQLFFLKVNQSSIVAITDNSDELHLMDHNSRVCFVLQPPPTELRRVFQFIERFAPHEQMAIQVLGNNIIITGRSRDITEMLKIYSFISQPKHMLEYRLVALQKAQSEEVATILETLFEGDTVKSSGRSNEGVHGKQMGSSSSADTSIGFRVIPLKYPAQSLFLIGKNAQIEKATQIIQEVESRISEVQDKTIHWYSCKHSEAQELADVLDQVYNKMVAITDSGKKEAARNAKSAPDQSRKSSDNRLIVQPPKITPFSDPDTKSPGEKHENFIVDTKTNSIVMVVEASLLPKLRELVKKLDVPKKMVQLDILLFEKRVADNNTFGLNLFRSGQAASDKHVRSVIWNDGGHKRRRGHKKHHKDSEKDDEGLGGIGKGILQFIISRHKHGHIPAYDLAYSFLLAQEDIQINANPSVTTVNQTPAKIAVVEQISINTGVVEIDTTKATRLKDSYSREEYGITIQVTPTIHAKIDDEDDPTAPKFIHLATDVVFDTTHPNEHDRPDVTRRNIKNEVRVADGETVILGGLRRKIATDSAKMTPFLGELPGIGKLFSLTEMTDSNTEMYIFLTPRIVPDKIDEFRAMRQKEFQRRPGDVPEFVKELEQVQMQEKKGLFENSMKMLLGR